MTMMGRLMILLGIGLVLAGTALAVGEAGWTGYGRISELRPTTAGRFLFRLDVSDNPSGCREKQWFYTDYGRAGSEYLFQALLNAFGSEKRVSVHVTGGCDLNGYAAISAVSVLP